MEHSGRVIKCHSNFFDVLVGGAVVRTVLRGRLRLARLEILAGDLVDLARAPDGCYVVERVLPRKNVMRRPPVANVDLLLVVFTLRDPPFNPLVVDKLLVLAESRGFEAMVCLNKSDLYPARDSLAALEPYRLAGYRTVVTSAVTGAGIEELRGGLSGGVAVIAGQSGVGKSSLLNALIPGAGREVSGISRKRNMGRHTTKGVDLLSVPGGGLVADTPGFTKLEMEELTKEDLLRGFPEIRSLEGTCRFSDCVHRNEPDCAVKEAVASCRIGSSRYESYLAMFDEVEMREQRRYR